MACNDNLKRIVSISHGGTTPVDPVGASITEDVGFLENRPGTRKAPCTSMDTYSCSSSGEWQTFQTPIVRGTSATYTVVAQKYDESGNVSVAVVTMLAGAAKFDFNSSPAFRQGQAFRYNSGNSENFAPISVS